MVTATKQQYSISPRASSLLGDMQHLVYMRTDRLFAVLLLCEWLFGIGIALIVSPRAWDGVASSVHVHVWYALLLGGAITGVPAAMGLLMPGRTITRHAIAVGQMLMCALLIHLTGGRIETHFAIFGSLAFMAFYRDWRVLVTATIVTSLDHILRGVYWPQSIYGVDFGAQWRWLEHAGWVVFEDFFLVIACAHAVTDMRSAAEREADLEMMYQSAMSSADARKAGMAEVAAGVLHNVGNVLNSVNVSISMLDKQVRNSKVPSLSKAASLLIDHQDGIGAYLEQDEKGKRLPEYLVKLSDTLMGEQEQMQRELQHLAKGVDHIKDIVNVHQQYAGTSTVVERVNVADLVRDALQMNAVGTTQGDIEIVTECLGGHPILLDKHKVLQILMNLIGNAKHALDGGEAERKTITIRSEQSPERLRVSVADNGIGISEENLAKMFTYGFTTRKDGHGFGLHSCALAAQEMNGAIAVSSDGVGKGATFTLDISLATKE